MPRQPLVDSKHCVIPGCTTHHCAARDEFYCRTANSKVDTITTNISLGFSTTTGSDRHWYSILDSARVSVGTKVLSAGISRPIYFWFLAALLEYTTGGSELSEKSMNFWNCLHKVKWTTLIAQEMQKSMKGSLKLLYLPVLFLHC